MKIIPTAWCFWAWACTINQTLILVHPAHKDNKALLEHELEHTRQMAHVGGALRFWLKYFFQKSFRLVAEVEAYKVEIFHGASLHRCASNLCTRYALGITQARAMQLLES